MKKNVVSKLKNLFVGEIQIPKKLIPGILKVHHYTTFRIAPMLNNDNSSIDTIIKSFQSIKNHQLFKEFRDGQPVVALELYANHQKSYYMMTVPTSHKQLFKERFQSAFEGGGIKEESHVGWPFVEDDENTLIAYVNLAKDSFFPLRMDDSMICKDVLHVTEDLKEGEECFLQILIEPVDDGWQDEMERVYEMYLQGKHQGTARGILKSGGRALDSKITQFAFSLSNEDEVLFSRKHRQIKEVNQKFRQSGFHVVIRIAVKAKDYHRKNDILEGIVGAIKTSNYYNGWQTTPVIRKKTAFQLLKNRQMPLLSRNNLLCEDELKVLLRFPTKEVEAVRLERMNPNEERIDVRLTQQIIQMGTSIEYGSKGKPVGFSIASNDTASKARLWIAPPGSGKSTAVKIFKNGAMEAGHGGSIFDVADGRLYYEAIETTPPEYRDRLVLVNFADRDYPHIFNFNSLGTDAEDVGMMFAEFFEVYFKTAHNHRMNSLLKKAAMTNFTDPDATFLELIKLMRDEDYRKNFLATIRKSHPDLFLWWKTEFPKIAKSDTQMNEILQPILYRLDNLQYNKRLGPIFCGRGGKLHISRWMNGGMWVLYNLSNGVFLENEQRMLMSFLNYAYWTATLQRESLLQRGIEPPVHHKMYDEPQTYMTATPIFELSISKSRKYRVSDNFLIQNPTQVIKQDEALWQQIIGMNPHIILGGGLDLKNLKIMAQEFNISVEDLKRLEQLEYHWYFKTYVGKEAIKPFIFHSLDVPKSYGRDKELERKWREYFAPLSVEEVKLDIQARSFNMTVDEYQKLIESYDDIDDDEEGVPLG
jgi:hypothetical protein